KNTAMPGTSKMASRERKRPKRFSSGRLRSRFAKNYMFLRRSPNQLAAPTKVALADAAGWQNQVGTNRLGLMLAQQFTSLLLQGL
ncbi:MAG TPA: hypothetical protein VH682_30430, partial [Gemmataceae bacterium]